MYYGRFLDMDTPMADTPIPRHFGNCQKIHLDGGGTFRQLGYTNFKNEVQLSYHELFHYLTLHLIYYILFIIYYMYPSILPTYLHQLISPLLNISSIYSFPIPHTTIIYTTPLSFPYTFPYTFNFSFSTVLFSNTFSPCLPQLFQSPLTATPFS